MFGVEFLKDIKTNLQCDEDGMYEADPTKQFNLVNFNFVYGTKTKWMFQFTMMVTCSVAPRKTQT